MSCAIFIRGATADAVIKHLRTRLPDLVEREQRCVYEYASSKEIAPCAAIADLEWQGRRWTELWDGDFDGLLMKYLDPRRVPDLPLGTHAFAFYANTTTDAYGFSYYQRGKLVRALYRSERHVVDTVGRRLAQEAGASASDIELDESALALLARRFGFPWADVPAAQTGYRVVDPYGVGPEMPTWATWQLGTVADRDSTKVTHQDLAQLRRILGIRDEEVIPEMPPAKPARAPAKKRSGRKRIAAKRR
jgi:hypothetical protein